MNQFLIDVWILANVHAMDSDELGVIANRVWNKLLEEHTREELDKLAYGEKDKL